MAEKSIPKEDIRCVCGHVENMHYAPSGACCKVVAPSKHCTCKEFRPEGTTPTEPPAVEFLVPVSDGDGRFGAALDILMPSGADVVLLCVRGSRGLVPLRVLLPHQVYARDVAGLLSDVSLAAAVVVPLRSAEYVDVAVPARTPVQPEGGAK